MKTAVPSDLSADDERLAEAMNKSRRQLHPDALRESVARHVEERLMDALDELCSEVGAPEDKFAAAAGRRRLRSMSFSEGSR